MIQTIPAGSGTLDVVLTNYVRGYQIPGGVADILAPRIPVGKQTGKYLDDDSDQALLIQAKLLRAPGARAAQVSLSAPTLLGYDCQSRALETPIPDEDQKRYSWGDLTQKAANYNQKRIMTDREIRVGTKFQDPTNYTNTLALSGTDQIDNAASDPVSILEEGRETVSLYAEPNTLVLAPDVFRAMRTNPKLIARFQGVVPVGGLNEEQLALILDVDRVVVAKPVALVNGTRSRIWSNTMILCYLQETQGAPGVVNPDTGLSSVGPLDASFGKTFVWTEAPGTVEGYGVITQRDPYASAKSTIVSNDWYADEQVTAPKAAFLWTDVLADE